MTVQVEEASGARHSLGERGLTLAAISRAVVRIHKQFYGKGPTKARAHLHENVLTVVLEKGLMRSEQTLCERGRVEAVVRGRMMMQGSIEHDLRVAIESELRRPLRSVMYSVDPYEELEVIVAVLARNDVESLDGGIAGDLLDGRFAHRR